MANQGELLSPSPTQQRRALVSGVADFDKRYPPGPSEVGTAEEAVDDALAKGVVVLKPVELADDDGPLVYGVPHQAAIECRPLADGGIELWQEGQHGGDDDSIVHVAANNAVLLARSLLLAAGFRNIGIYTHTKAGNCDLDDGDLASNIEYSDRPAAS